MRSVWWEDGAIEKRRSLDSSIETEVAIIGAGMAGMVTAYLLQEAGRKVIVLEKDSIASGVTGFTTAKITSQHGLCYHRLMMDFGKEKAQMYADANENAIGEYERIIKKEGILCNYKKADAYLYSEDQEMLEKEFQAAKELQLPVSFQEKIEFFQGSAVKFSNQAQFHPIKFLKGIEKKLTIYENTPVLRLDGMELITPDGVVKAKEIVFACHFPFVNFPGMYFMRMHQARAYFLALKNAPNVTGMLIGAKEKGYSLRGYEEFVLFGGEGHRTGENSQGGCYTRLREKAKVLFPKSEEVGCWSSQDCMTVDNVPYIGQFAKDQPHWYVATGFGKWGMTTSMVAGTILRDLICGKENKNADVFNPIRFTVGEIPEVLKGGGQAIKGLSRRFFSMPKETGEALPLGHGGVTTVEGEKVGVYKDKGGKLHIVDIACPHMGCQLEWNPDELSWDCPCHGSRFNYLGHLLSNPAQEDTKYE